MYIKIRLQCFYETNLNLFHAKNRELIFFALCTSTNLIAVANNYEIQYNRGFFMLQNLIYYYTSQLLKKRWKECIL